MERNQPGSHVRRGARRIVNTLTLVGGVPLPRGDERAAQVWAVLPEHQQQILER